VSDLDLARYARVVWRWLWLIIAAVGLAGGASYFASTLVPKMYVSSITLLVGEETASPNVNAEAIGVSQHAAATYSGIARRQPVLQSTVDALGLPFNWRELQSRVLVIRSEGSLILELRVTDTEPQRAQAIANELASQLILQSPTAADLRQLGQRRQFIREQLDKLQADIQQAESVMTQKQAALKKEVSARGVLDLQDEIRALETKLSNWRNGYALFLNSSDVKKPNTLSVIEPAFTPSDPISPNVRANVLLAAVLGLLLALGAIFLIEYRVNNDVLQTAGDVEMALGTAPLATLPHLGTGTSPARSLALARVPQSDVAEAYRVLRTSIQFAYGDTLPLVLLVTSPGLGEGKSVTSASLGASFAQAGKRTVLVDADLRNASLHTLFSLPNDLGLAQLLEAEPTAVGQDVDGKATVPNSARPTVAACLLPTEVPGLLLLPAGPMPLVHPGDLFESVKMRRLLESLRPAVDVVIVDSPPVLSVADTAVLASIGGAVLLVAEAGHTRGQAAAQAKELLLRAQARVLWVVLNKVPDTTVANRGYDRSATSGSASTGRKTRRPRPGDAGAELVGQGPR
jgi:capsular exopolysaccharide synthesis family protein